MSPIQLDISCFDLKPFAGAIIPEGSIPEPSSSQAAHDYFRDRSLEEVTVESVEEYFWSAEVPNFLTPAAYAHYLPALLKLGVEHQESDRVGEISDNITFSLRCMALGDFEEWRKPIVERYSQEQLRVIVRYLEAMVLLMKGDLIETHAIEALNYWRPLAGLAK